MKMIRERVALAQVGMNPSAICRMPSGWAVLCDMQPLRGYSILLPDPVVGSINDLSREQRSIFLCDMVTIGDALLEVTGSFRINYAILGNTDPALHANIVPRYLTEPEEIRKLPPWSYSQQEMNSTLCDCLRDMELIARLAAAIQKRL